MSQENVEAFKRAVDAFNRGDIEALVKEVDADAEWHPEFQTMMLGGEARVYRGPDGARDALRGWYETLDEIHVEIREIRDLGERIVAIGRIRARGKESGTPVESPGGWVVEFTNGKLLRVREFLDPNAAFEAAGLRE
jgi:ketosteroid isomerase-like protein